MIYLLDTNACIHHLKFPNSPITRKLATLRSSDIAVCSVTKAELFYGAMRSDNPTEALRSQQEFLGRFESLPFDDPAGLIQGRIRAQLAAVGGVVKLTEVKHLNPLHQIATPLGRHWEDTRHLLPTLKALVHHVTIFLRRELVLFGMKMLSNHLEGSQKSLGLSPRLESTHASFSNSCGLMGILRPVVQPLVLAVVCVRQQLSLGCSITFEFVCY